MSTEDFTGFGKIARLSREAVITEKLDGTNAQIFITEGGKDSPYAVAAWHDQTTRTDMVMYAGSRSRWGTLQDDNHGFAAWAQQNAETLAELGPGRHFGEWWGAGIQRRYGQDRKRFSLFNTSRWAESRPACCDVVPVLYQGEFTTEAVDAAIARLRHGGSLAAPGFMQPEGVIVYHVAANVYFKKTLDGDAEPKSMHRKPRS